jgi:hypothetical protein
VGGFIPRLSDLVLITMHLPGNLPIISLQKLIFDNLGVAAMINRERNWIWGFTPAAESLNGRMAMLGMLLALLIEMMSGKGVLAFLRLM